MPITADMGVKTQAEIRGTRHVAIKATQKEASKKRIAIYCRISSLDGQTDSIVAQREHFLHMVRTDPNAELVDVYYDEKRSYPVLL